MTRPCRFAALAALLLVAACDDGRRTTKQEPVDLVPATKRVDAVPGADPTKLEPPTAGVDAVPAETRGDREEAAARIPDSDR